VLAIPSCAHTTDQPMDARINGTNDGSKLATVQGHRSSIVLAGHLREEHATAYDPSGVMTS
jgi:hypothetical protein